MDARASRLLLAIPPIALSLCATASPALAEETGDDTVEEVIQELFLGSTVYPQEQLELQVTSALQFDRAPSGSAFTAAPEIEIGLTDRFQLGAEVPLESAPYGGGRAVGVGNIGVGASYNVFNSRRLGLATSLALETSLPSIAEGVGEDAWGLEPSLIVYKALGSVHLNLVLSAELEIPTEPGEEAELSPSGALGLFIPLLYFFVPTLELAISPSSSPAVVAAVGAVAPLPSGIELGAAFRAGLDERSFGAMMVATWEFELAGDDDDDAGATARLTASRPRRAGPLHTALPPPARSASPPAPAAPSARPSSIRRFTIEKRSVPDAIDAPTGPAPCDFSRSYRGAVGKTPVSIILRARAGSGASPSLEGLSHYDREGPAIPISGSVSDGTAFTFSEKAGGTFAGSCDAAGVLRGTFTLGARKEDFVLHPRPAEWPGLYRVVRRAKSLPDHPVCRKAAKPDVIVEVAIEPTDWSPLALCMPTSPAKRKELLDDADWIACSVVDEGYRVFGLAKPEVEKSINKTLAGGSFEHSAREIKNGCWRGGLDHTSMSLRVARRDLLVVSPFSSRDEGGAHPMNNGIGTTAIRLDDGHQIQLKEIVDISRLRDLAGACLAIYTKAMDAEGAFELPAVEPVTCANEDLVGAYLWSCEKHDLSEPNWTLLPEGIVIGSWANPHAMAARDGHGPILPWAVLKREGLLKADSPVAHLWGNVPPADAAALACSSSFEGSEYRIWREQRSP